MTSTIIAVAACAVIVLLDFLLHRSHLARKTFAKLAGMIPRWIIWLVFLFSIGSASHLVSGWAMIALVVAISTFGFAMLAWLSASDKP